jgi:hypothetical protein
LQEILDKGNKGKGGGERESNIEEALASQVCVISLLDVACFS